MPRLPIILTVWYPVTLFASEYCSEYVGDCTGIKAVTGYCSVIIEEDARQPLSTFTAEYLDKSVHNVFCAHMPPVLGAAGRKQNVD